MSKLTKAQAKAHTQACELLQKDTLSEDDKFFVLENWQESASHINSAAGAFFTPLDLAIDFAIELGPGRIIDLCAGIGMLSFATKIRQQSNGPLDLTCVEINPDYVAVGKKILPEANWICASVFDVVSMNLGRFDTAMSNPPFGAVKRQKHERGPVYTGADFEFHVIDIASQIAEYGVFIVPQMSAGFEFSGKPCYRRQTSGKAFEFQSKTGMHFEAGCGIDTSIHQKSWRGVSPLCEVVCIEFSQMEVGAPAMDQPDLFGDAA